MYTSYFKVPAGDCERDNFNDPPTKHSDDDDDDDDNDDDDDEWTTCAPGTLWAELG